MVHASPCIAYGWSSVVLEAVYLVHDAVGDVLGDSLGHLAAVPPLQEVIDATACKPQNPIQGRQGRCFAAGGGSQKQHVPPHPR